MCAWPSGYQAILLLDTDLRVCEWMVSAEITPEDGGGGYMWTARVVTWMGSLTIAALLFVVLQAHAGRPLVTDDAYPVELGDVEFEFGIEVETTTQSYSLTAPFSFG